MAANTAALPSDQMAAGPRDTGFPVAAASKRLLSLDVFRGWTMFWIVGGEALFESLQKASTNPLTTGIATELTHTVWHGLRFIDLIWPSFMLMTGVSLTLSYAKRSKQQSYPEMFKGVLKRFLVLFLLGSLRESISFQHPFLVELSSALQPIGVAYLAAFLVIRQTWKTRACIAAGILLGYALLLALVPVPGVPAGSYGRDSNMVLWSDLLILGRVLPEHWGTVICTAPTISTTILGTLLGQLLLTSRSALNKIAIMASIGASCVLLGFALDPVIPIVMKMWTTSYGLASAGFACLMFTLFYWVVDVRGFKNWGFPFVVIGMNAVAIYMSESIIPWHKIVSIFTEPATPLIGEWSSVLAAVVTLAVEWLVLYWMYRRKIFLTA